MNDPSIRRCEITSCLFVCCQVRWFYASAVRKRILARKLIGAMFHVTDQLIETKEGTTLGSFQYMKLTLHSCRRHEISSSRVASQVRGLISDKLLDPNQSLRGCFFIHPTIMIDGIPEEEVADLFLKWVEMTAKIEFCGGNEMFGGLKVLWDYAEKWDLLYLVEHYACVFAEGYHFFYVNGLGEKLTLRDLRREFLSGAPEAHMLEKSTGQIYETVETWKSAHKQRYEELLPAMRRGLLRELMDNMSRPGPQSEGLIGVDPKVILYRLEKVLKLIKSSGNPSAESCTTSNSCGTSRQDSSSETPDPTHESNPASSGFRSSAPGNDHHRK